MYVYDVLYHKVKTKYMDINVDYEYEYVGCNLRMSHTNTTKACWSSIFMSLGSNTSICFTGPPCVGKTVMTKDLSQQIGKFCLVVNCNNLISFKTINQIMFGITQVGVSSFDRRYGLSSITSTIYRRVWSRCARR